MFSDTPKTSYLKKLPSESREKEHLFLNEATISEFLQIPLSPMVALGYVLVKQAVSLFGLEHKDDSIVHMLYEISQVSLDNEIYDVEKTIDVLIYLCKNHCDQYKRILEAIGEDSDDKKRVKLYAEVGLLYSETCIKKYSQQSPLYTMPEPLEITPSVMLSTSTSSSPNPLRFIDSENKKSDIEWASNFIEEYKT
ncbi:unnamed protein product [Cunninghamella echinulata]